MLPDSCQQQCCHTPNGMHNVCLPWHLIQESFWVESNLIVWSSAKDAPLSCKSLNAPACSSFLSLWCGTSASAMMITHANDFQLESLFLVLWHQVMLMHKTVCCTMKIQATVAHKTQALIAHQTHHIPFMMIFKMMHCTTIVSWWLSMKCRCAAQNELEEQSETRLRQQSLMRLRKKMCCTLKRLSGDCFALDNGSKN